MRKTVALILILLGPKVYGQYLSMKLDTTCYWVSDYNYYHGAGIQCCIGTAIAYVQKDTIINNKSYHKIVTYNSNYINGGWNCSSK